MKRKSEELKQSKSTEEQVKKEKPKKEFKIEIVKVGKLQDKTAGNHSHYECGSSA